MDQKPLTPFTKDLIWYTNVDGNKLRRQFPHYSTEIEKCVQDTIKQFKEKNLDEPRTLDEYKSTFKIICEITNSFRKIVQKSD